MDWNSRTFSVRKKMQASSMLGDAPFEDLGGGSRSNLEVLIYVVRVISVALYPATFPSPQRHVEVHTSA